MKNTLLLILLLTTKLVSEQKIEFQVPIRRVENVSFTSQDSSDVIAHILLSDGTKWKTKCDFEYELILNEWKQGDVISFDTISAKGILLINTRVCSGINAYIEIESLNLLPTIIDIEINHGLFSSEYIIHLNDGTSFKPINNFSSRWKKGQKVIVSTIQWFDLLINANLQYVPGYRDDRKIMTHYFDPSSIDNAQNSEEDWDAWGY